MIRPIDLLRAVDRAVELFGEDTRDDEAGIDLAWAVIAFLPLSDDEFDVFHTHTLAEIPNEMIFHEFGATAEAQEVFLELREFAAEGFTYGEVYDAMADRILPTLEATA